MPTVTQTNFEDNINGVYAEIYAHEGVTGQEIANGASYVKSTAFISDGVSRNCTSDATNDKLTLTKTGSYKVECSCSFTGTGVNTNWFGSIFVDGVEQDKIHFERKINTGGDYGSTQFGGMLEVATAPVDIDLRFRHDNASALDITVRYANLNVTLIGA